MVGFGAAAYGTTPYAGATGAKRVLSNVFDIPNTTTQMRTVRFGRSENTQIFESPISGSVQTSELTGGKWMATFNLVTLTRAEAQAWIAFLVKLRGMSGRFYAHDPSNVSALGDLTGSNPQINGGGQTGKSLLVSGFAASTTGVLLAGDAISFDTATWRERHIVTADVDSDSSGNATLPLAFPMRQSPIQNDLIRTTSASCIMRLADNDQAFWNVQEALRFGIQFSGVEVFK
jgi:hypothetical protein